MIGICACQAGELKIHFPLLLPPVFSILSTIILHAQPETVGRVFGIINISKLALRLWLINTSLGNQSQNEL